MNINLFKYWQAFCQTQHDVVCNQKYNKTLPYSFHLDLVSGHAGRLYEYIEWTGEDWVSKPTFDVWMAKFVAQGHDLIEDARLTYNDIISELSIHLRRDVTVPIAEAIFACTECRGRNRKERHSEEYYSLLVSNNLAVYVKLCDILANVQFSKMTHSSMYACYQNEFPTFVARLSNTQLEMYQFIITEIGNELRLS